MSWREFIADVIDSLAWPAALVAVVYILRAELKGALRTLQSLKLKYKDLEAEFRRTVDEAQSLADEGQLPKVGEITGDIELVNLVELARISPRSAVIEGWLRVSHELRALGERHGVTQTGPGLRSIARPLQDQGIVSDAVFELIENLGKLRNQAAHLEEKFQIEPEDASRYIELAERVAAVLRATP